MFTNLGRRAKFFLVKEVKNEEVINHNEPRLVPRVAMISRTPDEQRNHMMDVARLSRNKEKAA